MSKKKGKKTVFTSIRNNFIAGVVVLIPIGIKTTTPAIKLLRIEVKIDFFPFFLLI